MPGDDVRRFLGNDPKGGPLLADCGVVSQKYFLGSLYIGMVLSSFLALGQNRLRQGGAN
jgi:hypothetical protein